MVDKMMKNTLTQPQFNSFKQHAAKHYRQTGAVLITGLIFLVVLTLLVLSIMRSATLEERMASNARNRQIALQAAEAVIRDAEENLLGKVAASPIEPAFLEGFTANCTDGFCAEDAQRWKSINWDDTSVTTRTFKIPATGTAFAISGAPNQPRYYVEQVDKSDSQTCPYIVYRITARGVGPDSSTVILQTNFRRQPDAIDKRSDFKNTACPVA
jgi:type IV pilus assembly protein PilX